MKFCIEFDPNQPGQLPSVSGGRPDNSLPGSQPGSQPGAGQLPSHGGWDRPDNSLPGSQPGVDNSLPGGWHRPDNALPGIDKPVDPEYGIDPKPPGAPDQGLPMPSPSKPFTDAEKREILRIAEKKFVHTDISPMRAIVQAARWVLVTRKKDDGAQGGRPDNSLPGAPNRPDNSLPGTPGRPDNSLPGSQPGVDNTLPGGVPPRPGNELPGSQPTPTPPIATAPPVTPDQGLPPTATPKSNY